MTHYSKLSIYEVFISGLCSGLTSVSPDIILKFMTKALEIKNDELKNSFYASVAGGNLGNAKTILIQSKREAKVNPSFSRSMSRCMICNNMIFDRDIEYLDNCADPFHKSCIRNSIVEQIDQKEFPVKCPKCSNEISQAYIKARVSENDFRLYACNEIYYALDAIECPVVKCGNLIVKNKDSKDSKIHCKKCDKFVCFVCRVIFHENLNCVQYQKLGTKCKTCNLSIQKVPGLSWCMCGDEVCVRCNKIHTLCSCHGSKT